MSVFVLLLFRVYNTDSLIEVRWLMGSINRDTNGKIRSFCSTRDLLIYCFLARYLQNFGDAETRIRDINLNTSLGWLLNTFNFLLQASSIKNKIVKPGILLLY